jgi:hypothetical protein
MVVSSLEVVDGFLLVNHHLTSDLGHVLNQSIPLHIELDLRVVLHQLMPVGLSDRISKHLGGSGVDEAGSLVEVDSIGTNHTVISVLEAKLLLLIDFITNIDCSFVNENYFSHLIKFINQDCVLWLISGLKLHKHAHHEVSVLSVLPGEEAACMVVQEPSLLVIILSIGFELHAFVVMTSVCHLFEVHILNHKVVIVVSSKLEEQVEFLNELLVNVRFKQSILNPFWKLLE